MESESKRRKVEDEEKKNDNIIPHPQYPNGTKILKTFPGHGDFEGTIDDFNSEEGWYHVTYEDGDDEELLPEEVASLIVVSTNNAKRKKPPSSKTKATVHNDDSKDNDDSSESPPRKKTVQDQQPKKLKQGSLNYWLQGKAKTPPTEEESDVEEDSQKKEQAAEKRKQPPAARKSSSSDDDDDDKSVEMVQTNKTTTGRFRRAARKQASSYADDSDEHEFTDSHDEEEEEVVKKPKASRAAKKPKGRGKPKVDSDDESASFASSDASMDDVLQDVDSESEDEAPRKKKGPKKKPAKAAVAKKGGAPAKKEGKKMSESFTPHNRPLYHNLSLDEIHEKKEFLHGCGMEGSDDIVDRLVGEQVDKIGGLMQRALMVHKGLGSGSHPLQLGTACSGTDAPALALNLVQEQMELRGLGNLFNFTHEFSCENDPFKQAYLERNFDSVLYPDITKLSDETPLDVYGQEKNIPPFNMFVAGTSCKNFSMLRSTRRIDIEDKGCSGETFLAAVELLYKEKPEFAIFENVTKAPWPKMQEYATGKFKLSDCADTKAIKEIKDKNKELTFVLDENENIVVDYVPAVYGVRAGAVVAGFLRPGESEVNPITMTYSSKKQNNSKKKKSGGKDAKFCTLSDLLKANNISKEEDTLVLKTECTYCTKIVNVDTKSFGLPQTRERTYMFVWQPENGDVNDDLGEYWKEIVQYLKSPVRHSLQSFILQDDHDIIRVFREALRGPPGRQTARGVMQEPDFWTSASANLPHNKNVREKLGLKDEARALTNWGPYGKKQIPPHYWLEYFRCINQREVDVTDIFHASALRDAEAHDSNFASFFWNNSQNASKEKHRAATPGVAGCISPGGEFWLPAQGRVLLGCEKLLVQGIPYFRLALGNETEVQLGDLAGNAMSLTVVCATMLAAICCKELRRETLASKHKDMQRILSEKACLDDYKRFSSWEEVRAEQAKADTPVVQSATSATSIFKDLASLAPEAVKSSIWCTCESSGSNSLSTQFLQCKVCRVSCCRNCVSTTSRYNLSSHDTVDIEIPTDDHSLSSFQSKLRQIVPTALVFEKDGIDQIADATDDEYRVSGLSNYVFGLDRIKRDRMKWQIFFSARDNHGIGEAVAEFRITVGELYREEAASCDGKPVAIGMKGELTSFFPARTEPLVYGPLDACAVVTVLQGSDDIEWKARTDDSVYSSFRLEGEGTTDSPRVEVGLTDVALDGLKEGSKGKLNVKHFQKAKERGEERRWLYPKQWKQWPEKIHLTATSSDDGGTADYDISGTYERARCRQTTNQSALWIKRGLEGKPSLYILIQPNVNCTGPDTAVVSSSLSHGDTSSILAVLPWVWQPSDALESGTHAVKAVVSKRWVPVSIKCMVPSSTIEVDSPRDASEVLVTVRGISETDMNMLCRNSDSVEHVVKLNAVGGQKAQQTVRVFNSVCVSSILRYIAGSGLKYDVSPNAEWITLLPKDQAKPFGFCNVTVPMRPTEKWYFNAEREIWDRRSEPGASRKFHLALEGAPQPFELWLDKNEKRLTIKCFPDIVAHRAARQLVEGRDGNLQDEVNVSFRLSDHIQQSDPITSPFKVKNCDNEDPTFVELSEPYNLYERQQKVVSKMVAIEDSKTSFNEIEMSEQEMPGSSGLSLMAKASRDRKLCGGVICDAIGSGKTVVSISMILNGLDSARKSRKLPSKSGASLVVVPPGLIDQWGSEIDKFSSGLRVIKVYDCKALKMFTVKQFIEADVVIIPVDILEAKGYLEAIVKRAKLGIDPSDLPKLPTYAGQKELIGAKGVWIPSTSADPYGGTNSHHNQSRRNQSAYYTHVYQSAIDKLREKEFKSFDKGVPIEYFEFERVFVDEVHESLCTTKGEMELDKDGIFKEKNRRAGRELLGLTQKDIYRRPLLFRKAIFGLTGTPLLDSESRVIELANLMGCTYVMGLSSHWRKLERESCRDIFLHNYLEPKQSREMRQSVYSKCQDYVTIACCRNKTGEEMNGIELVTHHRVVNMTEDEGALYLNSQSGIPKEKRSFAIKPEDFDVTAGHDISKFLAQNARMECRGKELVKIVKEILARKGDEQTKIIVFTDGRIRAGVAARECLEASGLGCTYLDVNDSVETKNKKIAWYQRGDATEEDKQRPRVLVLHFEHAAGLNLQTECHDLILFSPLYVGDGGATSDSVSDASTEQQAIGRVFRPGQPNPVVNVFRIEVRGPDSVECLDGQLIRRNTDEVTLAMTVNAGQD